MAKNLGTKVKNTLRKEVELIFDNCPTTFDFTDITIENIKARKITSEKIDKSTRVMEKINKVDMNIKTN